MFNVIFYAMLCASPDNCMAFEPYSWSVTNEAERVRAFEECSILANAYEQLQAVREVDCYIEE